MKPTDTMTESKFQVDIFTDQRHRGFTVEDTDNENVKVIVARVASLDVVNKNNRLLPSGILGDKRVMVAMSNYDHDSIQGGFLGIRGTSLPVAQSDMYEKNGALWTRTEFDLTDEESNRHFIRLNRVRDVMGFSIGYYPIKAEMVVVPNRRRKAQKITDADFIEHTPTMTPASPGTGVRSIDNIEQLTDEEQMHVLRLFTDDHILTEFNRRKIDTSSEPIIVSADKIREVTGMSPTQIERLVNKHRKQEA